MLKQRRNRAGFIPTSQYDYTVNKAGQRTNVDMTGGAFGTSNSTSWIWNYNSSGELTSSEHLNTNVVDPDKHNRAFAYDDLGRRIRRETYTFGTLTASDTLYLYDGWNIIAEYDKVKNDSYNELFNWSKGGPGKVNVRLTGTLDSFQYDSRYIWTFVGRITIDNNEFDFNKGNRHWTAEFATMLGRNYGKLVGGKNFTVMFSGGRDVFKSGECECGNFKAIEDPVYVR